ncbi:MAG: GYD domain-containing protein [Pseudolabrys sp.]
MLFLMSVNFTEQGIRNIKDSPKRAQAAKELAKKCGCDMKEIYLTSGESDLMVMLETPNGDNVAKFALAVGSQGHVRTRTCRAWSLSEYTKIISELP